MISRPRRRSLRSYLTRNWEKKRTRGNLSGISSTHERIGDPWIVPKERHRKTTIQNRVGLKLALPYYLTLFDISEVRGTCYHSTAPFYRTREQSRSAKDSEAIYQIVLSYLRFRVLVADTMFICKENFLSILVVHSGPSHSHTGWSLILYFRASISLKHTLSFNLFLKTHLVPSQETAGRISVEFAKKPSTITYQPTSLLYSLYLQFALYTTICVALFSSVLWWILSSEGNLLIGTRRRCDIFYEHDVETLALSANNLSLSLFSTRKWYLIVSIQECSPLSLIC